MYAEDMLDPGTYVDSATGDIWEKSRFSGKWYVNGVPHMPFPLSLVPEQRQRTQPAVTIDDVVHEGLRKKQEAVNVSNYDEWHSIIGYPRYEVNRNGDLRYVESGVHMAPSMQDSMDSYYPLLTADNVVHLVPLTRILDETFPESKDK